MDYQAMPHLRFEIEGLKHTIMAHLGVRHSELGEAVDAQIDKALADYPFEDEVRRVVHDQVTRAMKEYFQWGQGRVAINRAIAALFEPEAPNGPNK